MSNGSVIPKKINRYIQRLLIEYEQKKDPLFLFNYEASQFI